MAWTLQGTAWGANAASGNQLDCSAGGTGSGALDVQVNDLLVVKNIFVGGSTSCANAKTTGGYDATIPAGAITAPFGDDSLVVAVGYHLRVTTADSALVYRQTLGANRTERGIIVEQWRPDTGEAAVKIDESAATGFDSTPSSGTATASAGDLLATAAIGSGVITVSGEQIDGVSATEPTGSPLSSGGDQLVAFYRTTTGAISGSATATTSIGDWGCVLMLFDTEAIVEPPLLESTTPADSTTGVSRTANIVITIDQAVDAGSGNFEIWNLTRDVLFESIPVGDGRCSISTDTITLNPDGTFAYGEEYGVLWPAGIVVADDDAAPIAARTSHAGWRFRVTELTGAGTSGGLLVGSGWIGASYVGATEASGSNTPMAIDVVAVQVPARARGVGAVRSVIAAQTLTRIRDLTRAGVTVVSTSILSRSRGVTVGAKSAVSAQIPARSRDVGAPRNATASQTPSRGAFALGLQRAPVAVQTPTRQRAIAAARSAVAAQTPSRARALARLREAVSAAVVSTARALGLSRSAVTSGSASYDAEAGDGGVLMSIDAVVTQTATLMRAIARALSVTAASAPTVTKSLPRERTAVATQSAARARGVGRPRDAVSAQAATRARAAGLQRTPVVTQAPTATRAIAATRGVTATAAPERSRIIGRARSAVSSAAASIARALGVSRSAVASGSPSVEQDADTGNVTLEATQTQTPTLQRLVMRLLQAVGLQVPSMSRGGQFVLASDPDDFDALPADADAIDELLADTEAIDVLPPDED